MIAPGACPRRQHEEARHGAAGHTGRRGRRRHPHVPRCLPRSGLSDSSVTGSWWPWTSGNLRIPTASARSRSTSISTEDSATSTPAAVLGAGSGAPYLAVRETARGVECPQAAEGRRPACAPGPQCVGAAATCGRTMSSNRTFTWTRTGRVTYRKRPALSSKDPSRGAGSRSVGLVGRLLGLRARIEAYEYVGYRRSDRYDPLIWNPGLRPFPAFSRIAVLIGVTFGPGSLPLSADLSLWRPTVWEKRFSEVAARTSLPENPPPPSGAQS